MEHYLQLLYAIDTDDTYSRIIQECLKLESEHPQCRECYLFHQLIGSTPPHHITAFDLPENQLQAVVKEECRRILTHSLQKEKRGQRMLRSARIGPAGKKILKQLLAEE